MTRRVPYLALAGAAGIAVVAIALTVVLASNGGSGGGSSAGPPSTETGTPTSTATKTPAPGPTASITAVTSPPSGQDTPVSSRTPAPAPSPTAVPTPAGPGQVTIRVLAPIQSVDIAVLTSFPPQYVVKVSAGLPNGCAKADGYEKTQAGNDIRIVVYNTMPAGDVACTQIFSSYDLSINLGSSFTPGQDYRLDVNGKIATFKAQ
jgi:hypothetical protein